MRTCLTVILSFILFSSFGQVRPENGATLNYTQVLFKTQEVPNAVRYLFSVKNNKPGNQKDKSEITIWDSTHVAIINDLEFGRTYSWYVKSFDASGKLLTQSEESEFSIGNPLSVNPNIYRYIVTQNELSEDDQGVLFLDYNKVAINRNGKPVWFLPQGKGSVQNERIRDLKMTQNGTLTFLSKKKCLEISIDNEELWSTPTIDKTANDSIEYYHHEFTKLPSGNYLALGKYYESIELNSGGQFFNRLPVSMIVEYNKKGDTVWQWSTREYIKDTDLIEMDIYSLLGNTLGHCNSVYEDTKNSKLYISFRNLDGVIVLDKKSKKVISSYGENVQSDNSMNAKGLFSRQHAATPIESNKIVVFNNSTAGNSSSVVVFSEYNPSKKLWEFYCNFALFG